MTLWFYIIAGATVWTIGDIFIKFWVKDNNLLHWVLGMAIWTIGLALLAQSFHYKNMAIAGVMMVTLNSILLIIVSWIFFKEQINFTQFLGIILGLVAIYLLD